MEKDKLSHGIIGYEEIVSARIFGKWTLFKESRLYDKLKGMSNEELDRYMGFRHD